MSEDDIHATSEKGVGEINPPRKQGEDAEGHPIAEKVLEKVKVVVKEHVKDVIENHRHKKK